MSWTHAAKIKDLSRRSRRLVRLGVLFILGLSVPAFGQDAGEDLEQLKTDILAIMDEANIPGASIALVTRDRVMWAGGLGKADVSGEVDATADTLFRIGSVSKSFTALAVMRLVEQGQLSLDTQIRDLVPDLEYTNPWAATHPITVAHLLEHTTGFDDMHFVEIGKMDDADITLAEGLAFHPHSRISRWPPGTHWSYANSGPAMAARVLEAVTGRDFEDYTKEHVFDPLGMISTTFRIPADESSLAKGYKADGNESIYEHVIVRPSGALNSTALEMGNYLRMMLGRGQLGGRQVYDTATIARIERPETTLAGKAGHKFGYGLGNHSSLVAGHQFHGHGGSISGFIATTNYSPELDIGYFVSINTLSGRLNDIAELIAEFLIAGREANKQPAIQLSNEQLQQVEGYYQLVGPRSQLTNFIFKFVYLRRVWSEDGRLYQKALLGGDATELIPVTATSFRTPEEPVATLFLVNDADGETYLQSGFEGHIRKTTALWAWIQPIALGFAQVVMVGALLFGLFWVVVRPFGKLKAVPAEVILPEFLAPLSLYGGFVLAGMTLVEVGDLLRVSVTTMALFLGTVVFGLLSLYLGFRSIRPPEESGPRLRSWSRLVAIACLGTAIFLMHEDILGLRIWSY